MQTMSNPFLFSARGSVRMLTIHERNDLFVVHLPSTHSRSLRCTWPFSRRTRHPALFSPWRPKKISDIRTKKKKGWPTTMFIPCTKSGKARMGLFTHCFIQLPREPQWSRRSLRGRYFVISATFSHVPCAEATIMTISRRILQGGQSGFSYQMDRRDS